MTALFQNILTASFQGGIVVAVVLLLRLVLRNAPRKFFCLLWGLAILRLLVPVQISSPVSLQPETGATVAAVRQTVEAFRADESHSRMLEFEVPNQPAPESSGAEPVQISVPRQKFDWLSAAALIWLAVVAGLALYSLLTYLRLRRRVREAIWLRKNIWESDRIETAFILGYFRPRIYLPMGMDWEQQRYILAHERTHLEKGDHWFKLLGFAALTVHWFNPLVWASYILLCKDIEMACDERVVYSMNLDTRKQYAAALLTCSAGHNHLITYPVAFGEVSVKERIGRVLRYKKPGFWISLVAVIALVFVSVCFLTSPKIENPEAAQPTIQAEPAPTVPENDLSGQREKPRDSDDKVIVNKDNPAASSGEEWADYPDGIRFADYAGETFNAHIMIVRDPGRVYMGLSTYDGFSQDKPGMRINEIMETEGAVAAVNAGAFYDNGTAGTEVGSTPEGVVFSGGQCHWEKGSPPWNKGFAGFNKDNVLVVCMDKISPAQAEELNIRDGCAIGPALLVDGKPNLEAYNNATGYNARTAIGQRSDGAVIFVCIDGRQVDSMGGTYADMIDIMTEYGAVNACNMAGGSASAMMYRDTEGRFGEEDGELKMLNKLSLLQSEPRRMPNYWMVRTGN